MSSTILAAGSVALDSIETPFQARDDVLGGAAVHFSAAAGLFAPVRLVGVVGRDFPMALLEPLRRRGVDLEGLEVAEGQSFRWRGRYHLDMNRRDTLSLELGVFAGFRPQLPASYAATEVVFLATIDPDVQNGVLDAVESPRLVACDTIDHWINEKREAVDRVFGRADIVFLNEEEARLYADTPNLHRAARTILAQGCRVVLIKKGENGALMVTREGEVFAAAAYPLEEVVDPTGAGDAFAGGVMGALARNSDFSLRGLRSAVVYGSVMASFAVENFGPERVAEVGWDEVNARYEAVRRMVTVEPAG